MTQIERLQMRRNVTICRPGFERSCNRGLNVIWTHGKPRLFFLDLLYMKSFHEIGWQITDLVRARNPPPRHVLDKQQLQDNLNIATRSNERLGHKWVNKEMEICPLHTITGTRQLILSLLHLLQSAYSSDRKIYGGLFINKVVLKAYQDEAGSRTPYWPVILHYSLRPKIHSGQ